MLTALGALYRLDATETWGPAPVGRATTRALVRRGLAVTDPIFVRVSITEKGRNVWRELST